VRAGAPATTSEVDRQEDTVDRVTDLLVAPVDVDPREDHDGVGQIGVAVDQRDVALAVEDARSTRLRVLCSQACSA